MSVRAAGTTGLAIAVLAGMALVWQLAATAADDPVYWPPFSAVAARLWTAWLASPAAWTESVWPSLSRLLAGWAIAGVLGIAAGIAIGRYGVLRDGAAPAVAFLRSIPPPAVLPVVLVLLGAGDGMRIALIAFGVVWPILLNTADGVASVDPVQRDTARAYRLTAIDTVTRVVLPAAAPRILAGLRVSLSIAVILMVISELYAALNGIGFELIQAQRTFRSLDVWAIILLLGIIGFALNAVLSVVETRVLPWRRIAEDGTT
ncbi:MAG TPA: ABC transporter permease subunit [Candidatus Limnocylindria bacterium]|nr:ABC transporter permease subunit [Candidatus Limnocylindria bacterium]